MPSYQCTACSLIFANPYQLKRHISEKHRNRVTVGDDHDDKTSKIPYQEEPGLWTDDDDGTSKISYQEEPDLWNDDIVDNDDKDKMVSKLVGY